MKFTGKNLEMVLRGISLAIDELHNQIATCPDINEYADDLAELRAEQRKFQRLLARIDREFFGPQQPADRAADRP